MWGGNVKWFIIPIKGKIRTLKFSSGRNDRKGKFWRSLFGLKELREIINICDEGLA